MELNCQLLDCENNISKHKIYRIYDSIKYINNKIDEIYKKVASKNIESQQALQAKKFLDGCFTDEFLKDALAVLTSEGSKSSTHYLSVQTDSTFRA